MKTYGYNMLFTTSYEYLHDFYLSKEVQRKLQFVYVWIEQFDYTRQAINGTTRKCFCQKLNPICNYIDSND